MLSDPIRGFFLTFKTDKRSEAQKNTEVFKEILRSDLLSGDKLKSSESLLKCMEFLVLDAEEFALLHDEVANAKAKSDLGSRRNRFHGSRVISDLSEEAKQKLKSRYLKNKFVSDDEKRKMMLLV